MLETPTKLPLVTSGTLCKRVTHKNATIALQISALIMDGQSGGGLFTVTGECIGLITSTVKLSGVPIRSLSLSIAIEALESKQLWLEQELWLRDLFAYQTVESLPKYRGKL